MVNFNEYVRDVFLKTNEKNPLFSLRAFAKKLEIAPSTASEIISGKRSPDLELATMILQTLKCPEDTTLELLSGLELRLKAQELKKKPILKKINKSYNQNTLEMDHFSVIKDWWHYAIINLIELEHFKNDSLWISSMLGITEEQCLEAIERLKRLKILSEVEGKLFFEAKNLASPSGIPSQSIRSFHKQILEKAITSLEKESLDVRSHTNIMIPANTKAFAIAREEIKNFRRRLGTLLETGPADRVYNLSIQLFPISKRAE
ncbi:MAG: TIGR02147 family protein [Bacteriovoracaceae bacterium]